MGGHFEDTQSYQQNIMFYLLPSSFSYVVKIHIINIPTSFPPSNVEEMMGLKVHRVNYS